MKTRIGLAIEETVIVEARALGIDIDGMAEVAISRECRAERNRIWAETNRAALETYATEVERERVVALGRYRMF